MNLRRSLLIQITSTLSCRSGLLSSCKDFLSYAKSPVQAHRRKNQYSFMDSLLTNNHMNEDDAINSWVCNWNKEVRHFPSSCGVTRILDNRLKFSFSIIGLPQVNSCSHLIYHLIGLPQELSKALFLLPYPSLHFVPFLQLFY
jgi:hypothetical protein